MKNNKSMWILLCFAIFTFGGVGCNFKPIESPVKNGGVTRSQISDCAELPSFINHQLSLMAEGRSKGIMVQFFDIDGKPAVARYLNEADRLKFCLVYLLGESDEPFAPFVVQLTPACARSLVGPEMKRHPY